MKQEVLDSLDELKHIVIRIEEHIKGINGSIIKHENDLEIIEKDLTQNKIDIARMMGWSGMTGGGAGAVVGGLLYFILKTIGV